MDNFNSEQYSGSSFFGEPRWDDFTLDDENRARRRFSRFSLSIFLYMLISSAIMAIASIAVTNIFPSSSDEFLSKPLYLWAMNVLAMYVISFPIFVLLVRKMNKTFRSKKRISIKEFVKLFLVAQALMYVGNLIGTLLISIVEGIFGFTSSNPTSELISESPMWIIITVVVIIGPVIEELIFRKLLMDRLGIYGDRIAIIFSAVAFGLFHGNVYQLFYATLLGLLLAYVYSKTADIRYSILLHMLINFVGSVIPMLLMDKIDRFTELYNAFLTGAEYDMAEFASVYAVVGAYSFANIALSVAGIVILIKNKKRIFVSDRCDILIPKEKRMRIIAGNVGFILFTIFTVISMVINIFA